MVIVNSAGIQLLNALCFMPASERGREGMQARFSAFTMLKFTFDATLKKRQKRRVTRLKAQ